MAYNLRGPDGRYACVPTYPRKRASKCGCALGLNKPCPLIRKVSGQTLVRRPLDDEDIREFQEHDWELDQAAVGLQQEMADLRNQLDRERTFAGDTLDRGAKKKSAQHLRSSQVHRFTPTGRVIRTATENRSDEGERLNTELRHQWGERRHQLAEVRAERKQIRAVLRKGWQERPYEAPVAWQPSYLGAWSGGRARRRRSARA